MWILIPRIITVLESSNSILYIDNIYPQNDENEMFEDVVNNNTSEGDINQNRYNLFQCILKLI